MNKVSELNPRQWVLYNYLKNNNRTFKNLFEICEDLSEHYSLKNYQGDFNNSRARRKLTGDIKALKDSDIIQTVILSTTHGIKIASQEEYSEYLTREEIAAKKKLKTIRKQMYKASRHKHQRTVFNKEKEVYEAFGPGTKNG